MKIDPATVPVTRAGDGARTWLWSQAGGLNQFGAYIEELPPGAQSSQRHWHAAEDAFLLMLAGAATVNDDDGAHLMRPGDAMAWRHSDRDGHQVVKAGSAMVRFLIVGSRVALDGVTYPDSGAVLINGLTDCKVVDAEGRLLRSGDLPPELRGLQSNCGQSHNPASTGQRFLPAATRLWVTEADLAHPILGSGLGPYRTSHLGDPGGLTQFGASLEELPPGSGSSFRHWHETEDEMVMVLTGMPTLVEDTETLLQPGDVACWPAGVAVGHRLVNRSTDAAGYLVIGTRHQNDRIHYPDHDLITEKTGAARAWFHADGRKRPI